jgi:hypothetical protein
VCSSDLRGCGEWVLVCLAQSSHPEERSDELVEGLSDDGYRCDGSMDTEMRIENCKLKIAN